MPIDRIQGDFGVPVEIDLPVTADLDGVTATWRVKRPDGILVEWTPVTVDPLIRRATHVLQVGDLPTTPGLHGEYLVQLTLTKPGPTKRVSTIEAVLKVGRLLQL